MTNMHHNLAEQLIRRHNTTSKHKHLPDYDFDHLEKVLSVVYVVDLCLQSVWQTCVAKIVATQSKLKQLSCALFPNFIGYFLIEK